jgi:hypothetical protein
LRKRDEREIGGILGKHQFGCRRRKGMWDTIVMMKIISERTLNIHEVICACFREWHKAFDRVNWTSKQKKSIRKPNGKRSFLRS